jgi:hypothetical protein
METPPLPPLRLVFLIGMLAMAGRAAGEETRSPDAGSAPDWEFVFAPYLWGAGLEGTLEANDGAIDVSADVDVAFSDIWDALDAGVLAAFEARRGKLGIASNLVYLKLSADAEHPASPVLPPAPPRSFQARAAIEQTIFELRSTWEVLSVPLFDPAGARRIALDLGPGVRAFWLENDLHVKLRPGAPLGPFSRRFDESTDWIDFVGYARVRVELTERIGLVVGGDYGGFDVGSSSHRTWSLLGFFSYRLGEHWDLAAGWRTLEFDREVLGLEMAGPLLGMAHRF